MADSNMKEIFDPANELIREEIEGIDVTLEQLATLLADATQQVHGGVEKLNDLIDHQSGMLTLFGERISLLSENESCTIPESSRTELNEKLSTLMDNGKMLSTHMGQVLRALQVSDMINQLVSHCRPGMEQIVAVGEHIMAADDESLSTGEVQLKLNEMLEESRARLYDAEKRPVHQESMEEGDIEFF